MVALDLLLQQAVVAVTHSAEARKFLMLEQIGYEYAREKTARQLMDSSASTEAEVPTYYCNALRSHGCQQQHIDLGHLAGEKLRLAELAHMHAEKTLLNDDSTFSPSGSDSAVLRRAEW